ncbi:MAG: nucleotidyltransferase domain-containing protein [Clostridia bacterium]|nr:nucleotidyltransferase domain-containing protein [Clostridia bacterium]
MLTIDQISNAAKIIAIEYPVVKIQLFGSYAEGKNTPESDVDILLEFDSVAVVTLLTLCRIKNRMEELLNVSVDVVVLPIPEDSLIEINKVVPLYAA